MYSVSQESEEMKQKASTIKKFLTSSELAKLSHEFFRPVDGQTDNRRIDQVTFEMRTCEIGDLTIQTITCDQVRMLHRKQ